MERQTGIKSNFVKFKKEGGEKMKKISLVLVALAVAVFFAMPAMAAQDLPGQGIKNSKHNLGSTGFGNFTTSQTSQICVFCHTPHNSDGISTRPLWVRTTASVSAIYSSISINTKPQISNLVVAKLCLTCHDGATAPVAGANVGNGTSTNQQLSKSQTLSGRPTALTTDLSDDHPIGMNYASAKANDDTAGSNARLRALDSSGGPAASWMKNGIMDCSTCHELHNSTDNAKFLRVTRDSSGICRTCHAK